MDVASFTVYATAQITASTSTHFGEAVSMNLEQRIDSLERTNRQWRWLALALSCAFAINVSCSSQKPAGGAKADSSDGVHDAKIVDLIRARRIEVLDGNGNVCHLQPRSIELSSLNRGIPFEVVQTDVGTGIHIRNGVRTLSDAEYDRIVNDPSTSEEQRLAAIEGIQGKSTIDLVYTTAGDSAGGVIQLTSVQGHDAVWIGTEEDGGGLVNVSNRLGKSVVGILTSDANGGMITINDANGETKRTLK